MNGETQTYDLLRRWRSGDASALGELLQRDLPWIRSHVQRRLGPELRRKAETGDIVQEAMVHILEDGPRFVLSDNQQFRALIAAIVENVLRYQHRAHHQQRRDVLREQSPPSTGILDLDGTSPSQAAMRGEDTAWLELGLELLDPSDRDVIVWRQWDGLAFAEVGQRLGISTDHARIRFHRALAKLGPLMRKLRGGQLATVLAEFRS